jgi:predicted Zn-dependent peptidase
VSAEEIARRLMFGDHPLGYRITGPRANVARFSLDDVRRHHAAFYRAGNMILAVAGPVKRGRVCEAAARYLSGLAPGDPATAETPAFEQTEARFEYAEEPGSQTSVDIVFRAVPEVDDDYTVSLALLRILDDGMATRLHYRLCDQLGLAYSVGASIEPLHDVALLEIDGATAHAKVIDFMHAAFAVLDQLRNEPCTPDELDKVKRRYRYDMAASRDDAHSMASWFGGTALYRTPPALQDRVEQMDAVTAQDIQRVARQILRPDRLAVVVIGNLSRARRVQVREIVQTWGCQ